MDVNWWTLIVRMDRMERDAHRRQSPSWAETLSAALHRIRLVVAEPSSTRQELVATIDQDLRWAEADLNSDRGAWREDRLMTLKVYLLTDEERAELVDLARRIGSDMAAAQGLPC